MKLGPGIYFLDCLNCNNSGVF